MKKRVLASLIVLCLVAGLLPMTTLAAAAAESDSATSYAGSAPEEVSLPDQDWQAEVTFPDWDGYVDDTLAMNSLYSFTGFSDQGELYVTPSEDVSSFRLFINNAELDTTSVQAGSTYKYDISSLTVDGTNTIQVSAITPTTATVTVNVPYPTVIDGDPADVGMDEDILEMLDDFIEAEVKYGFSGAEIAVIKDGKLVVNKAYGAANGYRTDGTRILPEDDDYVPVTTDTLYDLASNTKMYSVNYALQYMLSDHPGEEYDIGLDDLITKFFPEFDDEGKTIFKDGTTDEEKAEIYQWKSELTIRDILMHQAGFDADPQYHNNHFNQVTQAADEDVDNPLYSQDRETTLQMVLASPLTYEPGSKTVYSDVDYMLLCFIVEKVTGMGLDEFLKEKFWDPMGLTHVTYNPLENGFEADDCAATELNGNHRTDIAGHGNAINFDNCREGVIQGTVHDEKAYYSMGGISGHAGLFANAEDLAKLCSLMLTGGYDGIKFFDENVIDEFTKPKSSSYATWGLGWWRQGDVGRRGYFTTHASEDTVGHQGWTGTLTVIDPDEDLVVVVLTNKKNSPIMDNTESANDFMGDNYVLGGLGIVTGFVYDSLRSSVDAMDAKVAQMAYNRSYQIYNSHQGAYDETPHMNDALALNDLVVTNAEKRPNENNQSLVQWIKDMNDWIFGPDYNIIQNEDDIEALKTLYFEDLTARMTTVLEGETEGEIAQPQMTAVKIDVEDYPDFFNSDATFASGHDQNAVYMPYAYGMSSTSNVYDNGNFWFDGYEGQGKIYISRYNTYNRNITRLQVFVNGVPVDVSAIIENGNTQNVFEIDVSDYTVTGRNIVQLAGVDSGSNAFLVAAANPEVEGTDDITLSGVDEKVVDLIDKIIQSDVDYGFPSAQLAIVKDGKMIYSNAWGATDAYRSDGTRILPEDDDYVAVTTDTLYDLASNTKMYATNYALQKLVADGKISLTDPITKYIDGFAVKDNIAFKTGTTDEEKEAIVQWKQELTIQDILQHQAGFDPDPQFHNDQFNQDTQLPEAGVDNPLYAIGKDAVKEAICKAPLNYEPGTKTVYSDVDFMLLGLIIEQVTDTDLDTYLKTNIYEPLGLTHITYNPLDNGFEADDCAATELNGNSRDGAISFTGIREGVIQGTVHDEKAYYSMGGVSGHAGLFSNAEDLAVLAQAMLNPSGLGETKLWSRNVKDYFVDRKSTSATWGQGWWRQGDCGRPWYFGVQASRDTIGHQGWTGTLTVIDPASDLVIAYLTNKINSPVTDNTVNTNQFDGNWYTASTLGFVSNILYLGLAENNVADDIQPALDALLGDMAIDKMRLVDEEGDVEEDHPIVQAAYAVIDLAIEMTEDRSNSENIATLRRIAATLDETRDADELAKITALLNELDPQEENNDDEEDNKGDNDNEGESSSQSLPSSASTSTTTYSITVSDAENGSVTANKTSAAEGATVTLTVTPDDGYELGSLTVTDSSGDEVDLTEKSSSKYTFTMPASKVTVTATFAEIGETPADEEPPATSFTDVPTDAWYADAVAWAVEQGITTGTSETTFSPNVVCTRAQMVTFLWRAAGSPEADVKDIPFTDVDEKEYYYDAVLWAIGTGITTGTSATTFSPDTELTRGETVTFLYRYADSPAASGGGFADVSADAWYADAVAWAVDEGVTNGTGGNLFSPAASCTRAEIVTFLYRDLAE